MTDLPYKKEKGQTHWEGCWATPHHHNCAVAKIDDLTDELLAAYEQIKRLRKTSDEAYAKGFADARERAEVERELTSANQRIEDALVALGEHPDSSVDIAERIGQIRDEGRGHFHTVTNLLQRISQLEKEHADQYIKRKCAMKPEN